MGAQQQHKAGAPVVGFNHNLNYKGRTFHVQTEDSGPQHAHIITHIFLGGNIFASTKSSYADLLPTLAPGEIFATVRRLMEEQHKAMMRGLARGEHDAEIARRTGTNVYEPGVLAGGEKAPGLLIGGDGPAPAPGAKAAAAPTPAPAAPQKAPTPRPKPPPLSRMAPPQRPARIEPRAAEKGFGDGLIGDRTLDEVILSYLAADLEGPKR